MKIKYVIITLIAVTIVSFSSAIALSDDLKINIHNNGFSFNNAISTFFDNQSYNENTSLISATKRVGTTINTKNLSITTDLTDILIERGNNDSLILYHEAMLPDINNLHTIDDLFILNRSNKDLTTSFEYKLLDQIDDINIPSSTLTIILPLKFNGDILLETTNGKILLSEQKIKSATLNTVSGDISIAKSNFTEMTVQTTSGDIKCKNTNGALSFNTVSGNIKTSFEFIDREVVVNTVSGNIDIQTKDNSIALHTSTISGDININPNIKDNNRSKKSISANSVSGNININTD